MPRSTTVVTLRVPLGLAAAIHRAAAAAGASPNRFLNRLIAEALGIAA